MNDMDKTDESEAYRYLAPEIDADNLNTFHELSAEQKEAALVYSLGLIILFHLTHTHPLSTIHNPKEAHRCLSAAPDDSINKHLSCISGEKESFRSLVHLMLSSDPSKRPTFICVRERLETIVHPTTHPQSIITPSSYYSSSIPSTSSSTSPRSPTPVVLSSSILDTPIHSDSQQGEWFIF